MNNKIVQVQATSKIIPANAVTYAPKTTQVTQPKITAGTLTQPELTTQVSSPSIITQVINMGEEALPNPSLFQRANDYYQVVDRFSLTFKTTKHDTLSGVSDLFNRRVEYNRVFQESQVTGDSYKTFGIGKVLAHTATSTEQLRYTVVKVLQHSFASTDRLTVTYKKNVFDSTTTTEELLKLAYKKLANELVVVGDAFSRTVNFNRQFADIVDATDDFYGSANVDDDQIANIGKTLVTWFASSDVRSMVLSVVKSDSFVTIDERRLQLQKPFFDATTHSDQRKLAAAKVLVSSGQFSDAQAVLVGKNLLDFIATQEQHRVDVAKALTSITLPQEQLRYSAGKLLTTQYTARDSFTSAWQAKREFYSLGSTLEETSFVVQPVFENTAGVTDEFAAGTTKILYTPFSTQDLLTRTVDYNREFADIVNSTDDFYGAANVDDDQYAYIGKTLASWATSSEQLEFSGSKYLNTDFTKFDVVYNSLEKVLTSSASSSDTTAYSTQKSLLSAGILQDQLSGSVTSVQADSFVVQDVFNRLVEYYRIFSHSATAQDIATPTTTKSLQSSSTLQDIVTTQTDFVRQPLELVDSTDTITSFSTAAVKLDTVALSNPLAAKVTRPVADTGSIVDVLRNTPRKAVLDQLASTDSVIFYLFTNRYFDEIVATNDSGFINNQGYFAESYVEPGYVGTNTYFS